MTIHLLRPAHLWTLRAPRHTYEPRQGCCDSVQLRPPTECNGLALGLGVGGASLALLTSVWTARWPDQPRPKYASLWAQRKPQNVCDAIADFNLRPGGFDSLCVEKVRLQDVAAVLTDGLYVFKLAYASKHYQQYEPTDPADAEVFGPLDVGLLSGPEKVARRAGVVVLECVFGLTSEHCYVYNPWAGFGGLWISDRHYRQCAAQRLDCLKHCAQLVTVRFG